MIRRTGFINTISGVCCVMVALAVLPAQVGCGDSGDTKVIMPGEGYQLTEQEKINKQLEKEARRNPR